MKYYSEKLDKLFDTEQELVDAENAEITKEENRQDMLAEIIAYKTEIEAMEKDLDVLIKEYTNTHGILNLQKSEDGCWEEVTFPKKWKPSTLEDIFSILRQGER